MKKTTKIIIWAIIIILVIAFAWFLSKNKNSVNNETIKIGADLSLSGDAAQDGESIKWGLELAKADLAKKGINVEIIYQDDKTEPKDTVSAINFLSTQGVQAIIGPTWSFLADAGVPVADRLGIVLVQPANTSEYVSARSPYTFFATTKVAELSAPLAQWLKENNKKSIAIISNQGAWYDTVGKAVENAANMAGAKVVFKETMPFGSTDALPTLIAKLKDVKADLFFTEIDDEQGIVVMLKKVAEQKITAPIMSVTTSIGRVVNENKIPADLTNKFYIISPESSKEFSDKFYAMYKKTPGAYADRAYDSLMLLVDAIQKKGTTPLNEYLKNTTNYKGFAGQYDFDNTGDIVGGEWIVRDIK